jgi:phosphoribosylformylglycinamidine (FGAM) synthase PurS component
VKVEAVIRRKTQDLVRDAAENLLRGSVDGVRHVDRADLWTFEVDGDDAAGEVRRMLDETTLVVNPNVHRYSLDRWDGPPESGTRLFVRVCDRVDPKGAAVLRAVRDRLGRRRFTGTSRAVLWIVDLDTDDAAAAERAGREMVGRTRGAGILANGHAQDAEIRVVTS